MQTAIFDSRKAGKTDRRVVYLDILRAIAIISITTNHAVNRSFAIYSGQLDELQSIPFYVTVIKAGLYAFSRIGVPLFLMLSGALLLPREYSGSLKNGSISRFIKHNWLHLLITTEIWLVIMFWYRQIFPDSLLHSYGIPYTLFRFVLTLLFITPDTMGSMWYMEMILCVYLIIPILSIAVKKIDYKYFLIPMSIVIFCSYIVPDLNNLMWATELSFYFDPKLESANVFSMYVVYMLLGYYLSTGALTKIRNRTLWLSLITAYIIFCVFQIYCYSVKNDVLIAHDYRCIFPLIIAVALFELMRRYKNGKFQLLETLSTKLSIISFGVYFVHICIMEGLTFILNRFYPNIYLLWKVTLLESVSFFGSIVIIHLCSKNKLMRRYLFNIKG